MLKLKVKIWVLPLLMFSFTTAADTPIPKSIEPFFKKYCYSCHDADTEKGDLNLQGLSRKISNVTDAEHWQDILDNLNAGEMPPKKKKQPNKQELSLAINDLTNALFQAQKEFKNSRGAIVLRRLNKREYESTIKELFGLNINVKDLPDDPAGRFDTIGQNQSLNSLQLQNYFDFAQRVSSMALHWSGVPRKERKTERKEFANTEARSKKIYEMHQKVIKVTKEGKTPKEAGLSEKEWAKYNPKGPNAQNSVWLGQRTYYERNKHIHAKGRMLSHDLLVNSANFRFKQDPRATYKIRFCGGVVDGVKTRRFVRLMRDGTHGGKHGVAFGSLHINGTIDKPSIHEAEFKKSYEPGFIHERHRGWGYIYTLEDKRGGPGFEQFYHHYKPIEPGVPKDTIFVKWLELEGPIYQDKSIFEQLTGKYKIHSLKDGKLDEIVKDFLQELATAVFRNQEVPNDFIAKLHSLYKSKRASGQKFKEAIVDPMAMILTSTRFLYLLEPSESKKLNLHALANRLSFFLWSSPPDKELYNLALSGELGKEKVLKSQVDRMLESPKAEKLFAGFMSQWMHLKRFNDLSLDSKLLIHRTDAVIEATKREPIEFFKTLVLENLCSSNLIDSDFVVVNGVLAMKYGLDFKHLGNEFQKVKLPKKSPRGGLMTQAAFLSMGTMGNRTSPVIRGALVKEILLNDPPPPPPPNVPELVHKGVDPLSSVRTLVKLHQQKAQCASCHARFDFIGLGLENFDPVGMWRDKELVTLAKEAQQIRRSPKKYYKVDASGELPNGTTFKNIFGLKKALMKGKRQVASSLFEGLLCYALGRDISFTDKPFINEILNNLSLMNDNKKDYLIREMIKEIVISKAFQEN